MSEPSFRSAQLGRCAAAALVFSLSAACQQSGQAPEAKSAAGQATYAERYPSELAASTETVEAAERDTQAATSEFPTYPEQLKKTDYVLVRKVYTLADEAGKSSSYAVAANDAEAVSRFYAEEKEPLSRQVAGSTRYAAKDKGATDPIADAAASGAAFGLEKGLAKQLEEHLRASSDADRFIDDHEDELGKPNVEPLRKHAAAISRSSYLVHVAGPREKARLQKLVDESSAVERTLEREIEEQSKVESDQAASSKRKKTAKSRKAAAEEARSKLESTTERAKAQLQDLEKRQKELASSYESAFSALLDAVDAKAKEQPAKKEEES